MQKEIAPRKPKAGEPRYDLACDHAGEIHVAAIKSLTHTNEDVQLRLCLGQILRDRHQIAALYNRAIVAVLVVERQPEDPAWTILCASLAWFSCGPGYFLCRG